MPELPIGDLGIVVAAGGSGRRFFEAGGAKPKLFETLPGDGEPLFLRSIRAFRGLCPENAFVLVVPERSAADFAEALESAGLADGVRIVNGGDARARSVLNGLRALPESAAFAAVHDAARPFATAETLLGCLDAARKFGGAVVARRVVDTLKRADSAGFVEETVDRTNLWAVETPQIFPRAELIDAYELALSRGILPTDDAGAMEAAGHRSFLFERSCDNRKITFPEDLKT
jgi:2-C-methyl-D-erythritol 4-phosphate cytidylyltransferase